MSAHATIEELEALVRGELTTTQSATIDAHLAECESCQKELTWLRAETNLLSRRPRQPLPPELWRGIEARLPSVGVSPSPVLPIVNAAVTTRVNRARSQAPQWYGVAAAAAGLLLIWVVGGAAPMLKLRQGVSAMLGQTSSTPSGSIQISHSSIDDPPLRGTTPVSGAVTLRLSTLSADIEAVAGTREEVRAVVDESHHKSFELRKEGQGELRAYFDGQDRLESGHIRLELPPGSRLELYTASGTASVVGVGGDVRMQTASGDIHIREARNIEIETASGDVHVEHFSGLGRIHTVSGDAHITRGSAPLARFEFNSTSGELELVGRCVKDCSMQVNTVSGDVGLHMSNDSSYAVRFHTLSGDVEGPDENKTKKHGDDDDDDDRPSMPERDRTITIGGGAGQVTVNTVSGDLSLEKR